MKKLIFTLGIFILSYPGQTFAQPVVNFITDGYVYINYACVMGEGSYDFHVPPVYIVSGLVNGRKYEILTDQTIIFGSVEYEYRHGHFDKDGDGWIWHYPSTFDTLTLEFVGNYSKWYVGAQELFRYGIKEYHDPNPMSIKTALVRIVDPMVISGLDGDVFCSNPITFTLQNIPTSYISATWQIKQGSIVKASGTGSTATASNISNGNGQVIFNVTFTCYLNPRTYTRTFHFGPYSSSDYPISGPSSAGCNANVYYSIPSLKQVTSTNWVWPGWWTYVSGQNSQYLALRTGTSSGSVMVGVNNICGPSGSYASKYTSVSCYKLILSPNPTSDLLNVKIVKEQSINDVDSLNNIETPITDNNSPYLVTIQDKMGTIYYTSKEFSENFTIPVSQLKNGNYIIIVQFNGFIITSPFIKIEK
jgi:hypothetical protein